MGITRLRGSGLFTIEALAVISEESMIPLCEKYNIKYCFYKNLPLGEKLNYGLSQALKLEWDYIIGIGSDDLLKNEILDVYKPYFGRNHSIALDSIVFLNSETGGCRWVKSNSRFGAGKALSRYALEKVPKLYNEKLSQGMDNESCFLLAANGIGEIRLPSDKPLIIDIKSKDSVWDFNAVRGLGEKYPFDLSVDGLSLEEIEGIKSLQHVTA